MVHNLRLKPWYGGINVLHRIFLSLPCRSAKLTAETEIEVQIYSMRWVFEASSKKGGDEVRVELLAGGDEWGGNRRAPTRPA